MGKLASPVRRAVGGALLLCLLCGTLGALLLPGPARRAHRVRLPTGVPAPAAALHLGDHMETRRTVRPSPAAWR